MLFRSLRADGAASAALRTEMRLQALPRDQPLTSLARADNPATRPPPRLRLLSQRARSMTDEADAAGLLAARCCS